MRYRRFLYHPESDCVWIEPMSDYELQLFLDENIEVEEISKEDYIELCSKMGIDPCQGT